MPATTRATARPRTRPAAARRAARTGPRRTAGAARPAPPAASPSTGPAARPTSRPPRAALWCRVRVLRALGYFLYRQRYTQHTPSRPPHQAPSARSPVVQG